MRIVHYLSEIVLAHGGVVRAVMDLCAALAGAGHEVTLLCFDDRDVPPAWKQGGALLPRAVTLAPPGRPKPVRAFARAELRCAETHIAGARALHLHGPWEATNLQMAAIARARAVPYIVSTHGMLDDWTIAQGYWKKRLFLAAAGRGMLDRAACVLCTAEAERDQAAAWHRNPRNEVLPLLFDLDPFRTPPDPRDADELLRAVPGDAPPLLFLSRLHPKKGLEHLIDAAAILRRRAAPFRLYIAGAEDHHTPGYEAALRARADSLDLRTCTAFLGLVTGRPKTALLAAARASVLPTSQENWGFSLIESLAAGTPVITTRGVDIWPELQRSGGAVICEQSPRAVADAAEPLLKDPARAADMGAAGRDWALRELEPTRLIARYEDLYRSL